MKQLTSAAALIVGSLMAINLSAATSNGQLPASQTISQPETVWVTIGQDAFDKIRQSKKHALQIKTPDQISPHLLTTSQSSQLVNDIKVISLPANQISQLSEYMHHEFNRCGGFVFHDSLDEAVNYASQSSLDNLNSIASQQANLVVNYTIDNPNGVNTLLNALNISNLNSTVATLANYHNRYYTQQSGVDSANWIQSNWQSIAQSRNDISVALFQHSWSQPSVIATIEGAINPDEIVVIGGHLDSINSSSPTSGRAPGADDNASGIAVVTEALRAIVASGYKPARTIKFMGYAAEEVGLRGSKAIAGEFAANGQNVIGVVQFDMTGNAGTPGKDIVFMTDYTNGAQNDFMMQLIDTYLSDISYGTSACGYGCSDHASWHNEGFAASMPFESNMNDANSRIHTSSDTTFDENHSINFARLAVTYLAELAKDDGWTPPVNDNVLRNGEAKTGLAASQGTALTYTMEVPAGATNIQFEISGGSGDADLYVKFGSAPTDSSYDCRPYKNGNSEICNVTVSGGTYHVRVKAYSTFSGVSLTGRFTESGGGNPGEPIDQTINNISVAQNAWAYYTVDLSEGYANLSVSISGGTGDADLYMRQGAQPTTSNYDCRPYKWGNEESCSETNPAATVWHIGIRGYNASSGVTLDIQATP